MKLKLKIAKVIKKYLKIKSILIVNVLSKRTKKKLNYESFVQYPLIKNNRNYNII